MGYSRRGAEGRLAGAVIFDVALVGWFGMAVYGCLSQLGFF